MLTIEQEIFHEAQSFVLPEKKQTSMRETLFDWNAMSLEDLLFIHDIDFNELYEQWKKQICERQPCHHKEAKEMNSTDIHHSEEELKETIPSSCDCNLNEETSSRSSSSSSSSKSKSIDRCTISNSESIIIENFDECLTNEILAENEQLSSSDTNTRRSLFKLDKTTSMHSFYSSSIVENPSDFFTNLFIVEKNSSENVRLHLGKHEHWITNAMNSYPHPFHDHPHEQCFNEQLELN